MMKAETRTTPPTTNSRPESVSRIPTKDTTTPSRHGPSRKVQIGYRPFGGRKAAWTVGVLVSLLQRSTKSSGAELLTDNNDKKKQQQQRVPDPHYHWVVVVGDYYHQLQFDRDGLIWYENNRVSWKDRWQMFDVGYTTLNDAAIVDACRKTTEALPKRYNLFGNNCHHWVMRLLSEIDATERSRIAKSHRYHGVSKWTSSIPVVEEDEDVFDVLEQGARDDDEAQAARKRVLEKAESIMSEHTPVVTPESLKLADAKDYFDDWEIVGEEIEDEESDEKSNGDESDQDEQSSRDESA